MSEDSPPAASVEPVGPRDVAEVAGALARAFHDDPVIGWLLPDSASRPARLRRFFAIEAGRVAIKRGQAWTTPDRSGAALILAPGKWRQPPAATLLEGGAFWARLVRAARLGATIEWHHGRLARGPHYYVRDVGVVPEMQGRGLGSALLAPTLAACDSEGLPAYLEASSERNAALYERLGFRLTEELRVGGCPPLRLMIREPHGNEGAE